MKRTITIVVAGLALGLGGILAATPFWPSFAQSVSDQSTGAQTATFEVKQMTCALCPLTVKTAMKGVEGVRSVEVDFETKTATVVFDPAVTSAESIAAASTNIGYPAREAG